MQLGVDFSTSHVEKSFIGTGFAGLVALGEHTVDAELEKLLNPPASAILFVFITVWLPEILLLFGRNVTKVTTDIY